MRKDGKTLVVDWSTEGREHIHNPSAATGTTAPWLFFYSDVEHEILPITSGHRLTIAYDVYSTDAVKYTAPVEMQALDVKSTALFGSLQSALTDREFLENGGRLAFALSYEYPAAEMEEAKVFNAILKGTSWSPSDSRTLLLTLFVISR